LIEPQQRPRSGHGRRRPEWNPVTNQHDPQHNERHGHGHAEPTPFLRTVLSGRRVLQRARRRIDVADGTAEQLPVDDRSVDGVWAVNTMHHWTDPAQGVAEIARALRPSGRVVLVDEDFQDTAHPDHERFGSNHDDGAHHGFTMVDAAQVGELLANAGLVDINATKRPLVGRPSIVVTARAASSEP